MSENDVVLNGLKQIELEGQKTNNIIEIKGGWDSRVFLFDDKYIVKVPRKYELIMPLKKEQKICSFLQGKLNINIPNMKIDNLNLQNGENTVFVYYEKIEGIELSGASINKDELNQMACEIGIFLRKLHNMERGEIEHVKKILYQNEGERVIDEELLYQKVLEYFENDVSSSNVPLYLKIIRNAISNIRGISVEKLPSHGDLMTNNILYNTKEGKISGIIDWGDFSLRDPAYDLAGLCYEFGYEFLDRLIESYNYHENTKLRKRAIIIASMVPFVSVYFSRNLSRKVRYGLKSIEISLNESGRTAVFKIDHKENTTE
ncbi:MAG: aminoglycoside phosphotransferase family protein [Thermoplasmataceae archaeon]